MRILTALLILTLFTNSALRAESLNEVGDKVFEQKVLDVIMKNPEVIQNSLKALAEKKRKEQEEKKINEIISKVYKLELGNSPSKGKKDAKYKLVVFTDFQCPYCRKGDTTVYELEEEYGDDLLVVFKNYPLAFHKNAVPAAKAALAAHEQGKFFEYAEELFESQKSLSEEKYIKIAQGLKLDIKKFKKDKESDKVKKQLAEDAAEAKKLGVSSTPNFFLNGVRIAGAYPFEFFQKVITKLDAQKN